MSKICESCGMPMEKKRIAAAGMEKNSTVHTAQIKMMCSKTVKMFAL